MKKDKMTERLLSVATYYYMDQMTQAEIADKFGISRQAVGRLLDIAKDRGIVDIKINNPFVETDNLANQLKNLFKGSRLGSVEVVPGKYSE